MAKKNSLMMIALILAIVGAINWGLIGAFGFNLVNFLLGGFPLVERIVYGVVGISGIFSIGYLMK
jgi:uncharacterized membrane protein YuzA (DUF378 family)